MPFTDDENVVRIYAPSGTALNHRHRVSHSYPDAWGLAALAITMLVATGTVPTWTLVLAGLASLVALSTSELAD